MDHIGGPLPPPPPPFGFPVAPPPPLPFGWTEHVAPGGQLYWYNAVTSESTYIRPGVPLPPPPPGFPVLMAPPFGTAMAPSANSLVGPNAAVDPKSTGKKKREKAKTKVPIEGTPWIKVTVRDLFTKSRDSGALASSAFVDCRLIFCLIRQLKTMCSTPIQKPKSPPGRCLKILCPR